MCYEKRKSQKAADRDEGIDLKLCQTIQNINNRMVMP